MSRRMNWRAARLRGRPSLDVKRELDVHSQDRAARWLAGAERRQQKHSTTAAKSSSARGRFMLQPLRRPHSYWEAKKSHER